MQEIFIPTTFFDGKTINIITPSCREIFHMFPDIIECNFTSDLLSWISFQYKSEIPEDIVRMCNGEFWSYYFIERDLGNTKVFSSGSAIVWNTKLFERIPEIYNTIDSIMQELASESLMTRTKMEEIQTKIQDTLFVLSGLIYTLERLVWASEENKQYMQEYSGDMQYESQALLLEKLSEQKIQELQEIKEVLYPKLVLFLETITKII